MPFPSLTYAAELDAMTRQELEQLISLFVGYLSVQHKEDGSHGAVTADSVSVSGAYTQTGTGPNQFAGDLIARFGTGSESGIGTLASVNGVTLLSGETNRQGLLIGGIAAGFFAEVRAAQSPMDGGTSELCIWNLKFSTTKPVWRLGILGSVPTLIDGGGGATTINFGDSSRPLGGVTTNALTANNGLFERGRSVLAGEFTSVAFASGNFTTDAGTWTLTSPDQVTYRYRVIGKSYLAKVTLQSTTIATGPTDLKVAIGGGFVAAADMRGTFHYNDNGTKGTGYWYVTNGATTINFRKFDDSTWANATNNTNVEGDAEFEVQ